jgi:hypothetical protein
VKKLSKKIDKVTAELLQLAGQQDREGWSLHMGGQLAHIANELSSLSSGLKNAAKKTPNGKTDEARPTA